MPGMIVFKRRWAVGSDDLIVPSSLMLVIHVTWLIVLTTVLIATESYDWLAPCMAELYEHTVGYMVILAGCAITETFIAKVSMRGTILRDEPRRIMQYLLYIRLGLLIIEVFWLVLGVIWLYKFYYICPSNSFISQAILGITITNWLVLTIVLITIWCTFDSAGRSWVKMQRYNNSLKDPTSKYHYRRSGNSKRNWRQRKANREYQDSWDKRCRILFCCLGRSDRNQNSFTEIAKLLSEFFRDLDVVPSDIVAGVILVRQLQRLRREMIINKMCTTYRYLSGIQITQYTKFLDVADPITMDLIKDLIHYLRYATAVYGWPLFVMDNATGCCQLCPYLSCGNCIRRSPLFSSCVNNCLNGMARRSHRRASLAQDPQPSKEPLVINDNCCNCNYAALSKVCEGYDFDIVYISYVDGVSMPPFFVAVDYEKEAVVVSIRGTLSLHDVLTDLNAEGDILPVTPPRENWLGHKGMIEAALYVNKQLIDRGILQQAFFHNVERGTPQFRLVLAGHSLGAGAASILAIMLREQFPSLVCYSFSPPGGLLSLPAVNASKDFITSVVLGKDVVTRLGLHQLESLRYDLIGAIKNCDDPKWKIIAQSFRCCCRPVTEPSNKQADYDKIVDMLQSKEKALSTHPEDESISLTVHQPLYPPGRIIHIVRSHPDKSLRTDDGKASRQPFYQALWAKNDDFDEILISPVMIQDHMPDKVLEALQKLLINVGPPKPKRKSETQNNNDSLAIPLLQCSYSPTVTPSSFDRTPSHKIILETSFADLQPSPAIPDEDLELISKLKMHRPSLVDALRYSNKLDLLKGDWKGTRKAPLASVETLSDSSSLSSQRLQQPGKILGSVSLVPKMDIIISQSPESVKSGNSLKQKYSRSATAASARSNIDPFKATSSNLARLSGSDSHDSLSETSTRRDEQETMTTATTNQSGISPSAGDEHRSQVSLQELIEEFSCSGKSSPKERHVSFSSYGGEGFGSASSYSVDSIATNDYKSRECPTTESTSALGITNDHHHWRRPSDSYTSKGKDKDSPPEVALSQNSMQPGSLALSGSNFVVPTEAITIERRQAQETDDDDEFAGDSLALAGHVLSPAASRSDDCTD